MDDVILKLTLVDHSFVSKKITSYEVIKQFPPNIDLVDNVAVIIEDLDFMSAPVGDLKDEDLFVQFISRDCHYLSLKDIGFTRFLFLMKQNRAAIFDTCGEMGNTICGGYEKS